MVPAVMGSFDQLSPEGCVLKASSCPQPHSLQLLSPSVILSPEITQKLLELNIHNVILCPALSSGMRIQVVLFCPTLTGSIVYPECLPCRCYPPAGHCVTISMIMWCVCVVHVSVFVCVYVYSVVCV